MNFYLKKVFKNRKIRLKDKKKSGVEINEKRILPLKIVTD